MRLLLLTTWLTLACVMTGNCQDAKKHTVYFDLGDGYPNSESIEKLSSWFETLPDSILKIDIIGYADFVGSNKDNLDLSKLRAEQIIEQIELQNHFSYKMVLFNFVGERDSQQFGSKDGNADDRKVVITASFYPEKPEKNNEQTKPKETSTKVSISESQAGKLTEIEVGKTLVLNNLNFYPGLHYLTPAALPELELLIEVLENNPNLEIEIHGHICCKLTADDGFDMNTRTYNLSFNRAKYVNDQLVLAGISQERLKFKGFAGTKPLVFPEKTDLDRARNRRVEIKVLKK